MSGRIASKTFVFSSPSDLGVSAMRRLHGHEPEHLEDVRHDDVAERAGRLVEGGPLLDRERLGHVELHVVDELPVPDGLEEAVREAEREDVLDGFLPEVVVDPEDLLLVEHGVDALVQLARALDVGAERLLDDHACLGRQPRLAEPEHDVVEDARRHRAEDELALAAELLRRLPRRLRDPRRSSRDRSRRRRTRAARRTAPTPRPQGVERPNSSTALRASSRKSSSDSSRIDDAMRRQSSGRRPATSRW